MLVPKGPILTTVDKAGVKVSYQSNLEKVPFEKMIVLTDKYTASAAEVIAGALQDAKAATLIGETTYGKGVVQSIYPNDDGAMIKLTTSEYFRRSGAAVNEKGIVPDINVPIYTVPMEPMSIALGGTSSELPNIKRALVVLGFGVTAIDNTFDQTTLDAVKAFQTAHGLKATGTLNVITLYEMNSALYQYYLNNDVILTRALQELK
jgi:carboxyl-terminal processing protease